MIRVFNRLAAALILAGLVLGPPAAVTVWAARQPWRNLAVDDVLAWAADPPDEALIWLLVASGAAALWLLAAVLAVRAAAYTLRVAWWRLRRMPLPTPAQATATSLAGTALFGIPAISAAPTDTPPATAGSQDLDPRPAPAGPQRYEGLELADGSWIPRHTARQVAAMADHPDGTDLQNHDDGDVQAARDGIALPGGGWIPYPTALAVTTVSTLIWLHRRQHYHPDPHRLGHHDHDPDLQPLPATADAITAALPADTAPPPAPSTDLAGLPDLPAGELTLHGPGAADAARGLLVTAALHTALHGIATCRVVVHPHELRRLLGVSLAAPAPDGIDIAATAIPDRPADSTTAGFTLRVTRRTHATSPGAPDGEPPAETVTAVTIADHPAGPAAWHLRADGTITTGPNAGQRLCVLTPHAATDLLYLVQHLPHGIATPPAPSELTPAEQRPRPAPPGQLTVLGGCDLLVDGEPVRLRRSAGLQILAYLAVHPDGATTTDLLRAVWPGTHPSAITKRLHTTLTSLRQQLQPHLGEPVIRHGDRYLLNTAAIDTDLRQLRQAVTAASTAFTPPQRQAALRAVTDAYRGDLAAGYPWPWLHPARERLRRDVIDAYLLLAAGADTMQAVEAIHAAATIDPYNATLHHRAQAILRTAGDHTAADAMHEAYTHRLVAASLPPGEAPDRTTAPGR